MEQFKTDLDFDNKYTMADVVSENFDSECQKGMLETFGKDLKQVLEIAEKTPMKLWTMVDCEQGMFLIQGYHYVNRIYYMVTNEDAEEEFEEYMFDSYESEEDGEMTE